MPRQFLFLMGMPVNAAFLGTENGPAVMGIGNDHQLPAVPTAE